MLTKKEVIERNYNLLERALEVVPLQILSCEEGLLESLLMANQGLMKVVRSQETKLQPFQALHSARINNRVEDASGDSLDPPFHLINSAQA